MQNDHKAQEMTDQIADQAHGHDHVCVGDMIEALGHRGFGPLLFVPAMIELTPIGGVPGVPTVLAVIIGLIAAQIMLGRTHFWLPDILERRTLSAGALNTATKVLRPIAQRMDRWFGGRLPVMVRPSVQRVAAAVVIAHCASVPFLELIPFASSVPMLSIALIGLAMMARDGVLMLVALIWAVCALIVAPYLLIW
ncbi:exopolysaccharide biosynthesis protein [Rhodobacteraceae bacterium KMM 6894]|nr:exopolysaccharide biosynthesis protein [Rhodobacteraceae bacterium KMM 6894]